MIGPFRCGTISKNASKKYSLSFTGSRKDGCFKKIRFSANINPMSFLPLIAAAIGFAVALTVHELAHAFVADKLGDPTARYQGRVSWNPLRHIDPIGTVLLPGLLILSGAGFVFGWAKPVMINPYNFKHPTRDRLLTALAGPGANLLAAAVFGIIYRLVPLGGNLPLLMAQIVMVNLGLMMFNLIPIPPLDGSAVLPYIFRGRGDILFFLEQRGVFILIILFFLDGVLGGAILGTFIGLPAAFLRLLFLGF